MAPPYVDMPSNRTYMEENHAPQKPDEWTASALLLRMQNSAIFDTQQAKTWNRGVETDFFYLKIIFNSGLALKKRGRCVFENFYRRLFTHPFQCKTLEKLIDFKPFFLESNQQNAQRGSSLCE
jgi:hypothetical protein